MIKRLASLAGYGAGGALLLVALVIMIDVLLRWTLSAPIKGLFEVSELVFAAIMSLAFADANYRRAHVSMELVGTLTRRVAGIMVVAHLMTAITFALFTLFLFSFAAAKAEFNEKTLVLQLPLAPFWYFAGIMMAVSFVVQAAAFCEDVKGLLKNHASTIVQELAPPIVSILLVAAAGAALILWQEQMSEPVKVLIGFAMLYLMALTHIPIGIAMAMSGLVGAYAMLGVSPAALVGTNNLTSVLSSADIASVPLFLLMGNLAVAAGFADQIFSAATSFFGRFRGGHAIATIIGCAGFGTVSGSSVATTATIGGVAYREMRSRNYAPGLATGSIAAGGTLGALIPPSVILIIYCIIAEQSIPVSFMASLVPGLLAVALYVIAIAILVRVKPELAPEGAEAKTSRLKAALMAWRPGLLFLLVIGGLYGGVFTAQEAAAVGTGFAFVFWVSSGRASLAGLFAAVRDAATTSATLYLLIIGANIFGAFLNLAGITNAVLSIIDPATTPAWLILTILVVMYLVLGSVFDTVAALIITVPFVVPIISALGYDLIWWGVVTLTLVEIGMITPPIGMNVFVMKSLVGNEVPISTIFKGTAPFLAADSVRLLLLILFPMITLWLPSVLR
jgi:C4-dicarboxylate transporter DctM subunit